MQVDTDYTSRSESRVLAVKQSPFEINQFPLDKFEFGVQNFIQLINILNKLIFKRRFIIARKKIAEIRREEIIKAFLDVVAEKGLEAATVRAVAESAEMSVGLIHHYFTNKEEMILAVLEYAMSRFMAEFDDRIFETESAVEILIYIVDWFLYVDEFDRKLLRNFDQFQSVALSHQQVTEALISFFSEGRRLLVRLIKQGIESGEFEAIEPELPANIMLGSIQGVVRMWLIDPENTPLANAGEELKKLFITYLSKAR